MDEMRGFFNGILAVLGATSLTDLEAATLTGTIGYTQANYDQLTAIVTARENVTGLGERVYHYFLARGATLTQAQTGKSNILVGIVLG